MRNETAMYRLNEFVSVSPVIHGMHDKMDIFQGRNAFAEITDMFYCQHNNKIKNYLHYRLLILVIVFNSKSA